MANVAGPPPPPPPPGQFRHPPPLGGGQQRPPGNPGGQGPPPGPFMPMPIRQPIQQSIRIQDISPPKFMDEAACLKKLTSYAAYTIRKVTPRDAKEKPTWAKAEIIEEKWAPEDILKQIKRLNESKRTVADKKAALAQFQQGQITTLLDDISTREPDPAFQWSLAQLDRKERPVSSIRGTSKKSLYETVTMTIYVKRAPIRDINPIQLYQNLEKMKAERMRLPPPQQQKQQQQAGGGQGGGHAGGQGGGGGGGGQGGGQQHGGGNQQQGGNRPPPVPPGFINLNKGGPGGGQGHGQGGGGGGGGGNKPKILKPHEKGGKHRGPIKYHGRGGSSTSDSDSLGSDSGSSSDESSLGTTISSSSRHHHQRRHSKGATRSHSRHRESRPKYYLEARSPSPDRRRMSDAFGGIPPVQHRPYVPEVPRTIPAHDPITSAYHAGKEDAIAERYGVADRFAQQPQPVQPVVQVVERIIEPRPVVSYGRMEPQYAEPRRLIEPRYIDDRYVDDLRSVEDDLIIRQRRAEDYIERRPLDIDRRPLDPRPEFFDRRPSDFERRPIERPDFFERRHSDIRPEYFERRPSEARQEFFDRRSPIARDFIPRHHSPPRFTDAHPFAQTALPRRYPPTPSTSSFEFERGW